MKKTCDGCESTKKRSEEWSLSLELAKSNRRMFIVVILCLILCVSSIVMTVWSVTKMRECFGIIEQYDIVDESIDVNAEDGGTANYIGNDGDIIYGENNSKTQNFAP